jgi:hypothetical protein
MSEIRIYNGAIEADDEDFAETVLRGTLDQECITLIQKDWYQRLEGFSEKEIREITEMYFRHKKPPDTVIGMRGHRYRQDKGSFYLQDKCFVIDGLQRLFAARIAMKSRPDLKLRIGVKIYFDTTAESENRMFCEINATQQRVAASVLIRNKYKVSPASRLLFELNSNPEFALKDRIGWEQKLQKEFGQVISGFALGCIAGALHSHKGAVPSGRAYDLLANLDDVVIKISEETFSTNIVKFFNVVDSAWGIRNDKKPRCLNREFLCVLASLFSSYDTFWDAEEFYMPTRHQKRLEKFDSDAINNQVKQMMKSNKDAKDVLFEVLRKRLQLDVFNGRRPPKDKSAGARASV